MLNRIASRITEKSIKWLDDHKGYKAGYYSLFGSGGRVRKGLGERKGFGGGLAEITASMSGGVIDASAGEEPPRRFPGN